MFFGVSLRWARPCALRKENRRMNNKTILLFITSLTLLNCEKEYQKNNNPLSFEKEWLKYEIGQTWTYRRMFINEGASELMDVPDTLYGYSDFEITKDTIFENTTWMIVEGRDYECSKELINEYISRFAITFTDTSLKVYQFNINSYGFSWGPFKRKNNNRHIVKEDFASIKSISSKVLLKKLNSTNYDSSVFSDLYFPLVFGVDPGYKWYIRQENDPHGNIPIEKVYLGKEEISVPAGTFNTYKYELLFGKIFNSPDIKIISWYSSNSLVKTLLDGGTSEVYDDNNQPLGSFHSWDIFEYLGTGHIDKDTLIPWSHR